MKCKVILNNGKPDGIFSSEGELTRYADGFGIFYSLDGDKCLLKCLGGEIVQERHGAVPMVMRFKAGEETSCTLGMGEAYGSFSVFTEKIEVKDNNDSVEIKLNYSYGGENTVLVITAKA